MLEAFLADGVRYLELRTTPRATPHLTPEAYVSTILSAIADFNAVHASARLRTRLILSVDRRHDLATASGVVELAIALKDKGVVGVDLCGDPTARPAGEVKLFTPVFEAAREAGLGITVHFAEAQASGSREELDVLLGWQPARLGHVIWEDEAAKKVIAERGLCLELCLSCNVQAEMVEGGYKGHHFGYWRNVDGPRISLGVSYCCILDGEIGRCQPVLTSGHRPMMWACLEVRCPRSTDLLRSILDLTRQPSVASRDRPLVLSLVARRTSNGCERSCGNRINSTIARNSTA